MTNTLHYGDNLHVLREHVADESVDLIYLDPPFNSNANYNILFKSPEGQDSDAQIVAFEDTWHWNEAAEDAYGEVRKSGATQTFELLRAMRGFLGDNDMMAYLSMMAVRLLELHRVLKLTGSLYLHCDPTASHYLKLLLDGVFGPKSFRSELIWKRTSAHGNTKRNFAGVHDIILYYSKGTDFTHNQVYRPYSSEYIEEHFVHIDEEGRRFRRSYLRNPGVRPNLRYDFTASNGITYQPHPNGWAVSRKVMEQYDKEGRLFFPKKENARLRKKIFLEDSAGVPVTDIWEDLPPIHASAAERLGYPTQKPLALLKRIIAASSNEGDVVLDPFCGYGTAVHAAQKLGRKWIGIDVTHLAVSLIEKRMHDAFPGIDFAVKGRPESLDAARDLAERDKNEFEKWAVTAIDGQPYRTGKGADGGVDGLIYFNGWDGEKQRVLEEKAIISVKGGENKGVGWISELVETIGRQNAAVGILLMAANPTRQMEARAAAAGTYDLGEHGRYPRIQIITLAEYWHQNKRPRLPNIDRSTMKRAKREVDTKKSPKLL